uniref:Retrotransposon protein, putative, unclassified n=1 Tax=Oryza sativa subsp. japonica TaxID=39947 RepID=Q2QWK7_ORYSJ|nr:retrotransposon protein, putative, unclassified [Oryza sativa Japonica Group]
MKDLGSLHHLLGISVSRQSSGLHLSQRQYYLEVLEHAGMADCKPCATPVDTNAKLSATDGAPARHLLCCLAGLPSHARSTGATYVRGTVDYGLHIRCSSTVDLSAYSDADWAGCPDTRKSTSDYAVFLGDNLVSWSSKRQLTVSCSSAKAEYGAVANAVAETCWLRQLLHELHTPPSRSTLVYCDNVSAVYLSSNPVQHQRTKHVEIDLHFVRDRVAAGSVRVLHVPTTS